MVKICKFCHQSKNINEFDKDQRYEDGRRNKCKSCKRTPEFLERISKYNKEYGEKYRIDNKEKMKLYMTEYCDENYERLKEQKKQYYEDNKDHILNRAKLHYEQNKEKKKIYRQDNKERIREYKREYECSRKINDGLYKLSRSIRSLITISFKNKFTKKSKKTIDILGCDFQIFKDYIECQFDENMSWSNHGIYWHLDHKIPVSWAKSEEEVYLLNHYTNFQPLYWKENLIKGNRYETN